MITLPDSPIKPLAAGLPGIRPLMAAAGLSGIRPLMSAAGTSSRVLGGGGGIAAAVPPSLSIAFLSPPPRGIAAAGPTPPPTVSVPSQSGVVQVPYFIFLSRYGRFGTIP